jgi:hypothetical protein
MRFHNWCSKEGRSPVEDALVAEFLKDHHAFQRYEQAMEIAEHGEFLQLRKNGTVKKVDGENPGELHVIDIDIGKTIGHLIFIMISPADALLLHFCTDKNDGIEETAQELATERAKQYWGLIK